MPRSKSVIYLNKTEAKDGVACTDTNTILRVQQVAKWVSEGSSSKSIMNRIMDTYEIKYDQAQKYYNAALRYLASTEEEMEIFRQNMWKIQVDRLEKIMDKGIDSDDPQMLRVAKDCIAEINKLLGMTQGDKVTIANNKEGEQIIEIKFGE